MSLWSNNRAAAGVIPDVIAHVQRHAASYYPELAGEAFTLRRGFVRPRQFSHLFELKLVSAQRSHRILAKIALPPENFSADASADDVRSYFLPTPDAWGAEYQVLSAFARRVASARDDRFFAVRVLDSILDDQALILEFAAARPLTTLVKSAARRSANASLPELMDATTRTGACLRLFHGMEVGGQRQIRGATKDEFLAWVDATESFVGGDESTRSFFRRMTNRMHRLVEELLPHELPAGPLHDDFAPRNVLVDAEGRVAIIDMLEEWAGCIWTDIARFLVSIGANKGQAISRGRMFSQRQVDNIRQALLTGYYGDDAIPLSQISLYECQTTLTQWAAMLHGVQGRTFWKRALKRAQLAASAKWYAQYSEACLSRAESLADSDAAGVRSASPFAVGGAS